MEILWPRMRTFNCNIICLKITMERGFLSLNPNDFSLCKYIHLAIQILLTGDVSHNDSTANSKAV